MRRMVWLVAALVAVAAVTAACAPGGGFSLPGPNIGTCFSQPLAPPGQGFDLLYTGYNSLDNLSLRNSFDGSCSGEQLSTGTMVVALDEVTALGFCQLLDPAFNQVGNPPEGALIPDPGPYFFSCITVGPPGPGA